MQRAMQLLHTRADQFKGTSSHLITTDGGESKSLSSVLFGLSYRTGRVADFPPFWTLKSKMSNLVNRMVSVGVSVLLIVCSSGVFCGNV